MAKALSLYLGRITPWQVKNPRYVATVSNSLEPIVTAGALIASLPAAFDLDTAIGTQLDVVGEWVGRARTVRLPIPQPWFSFDDDRLGFDRGVWKGPFSGTSGVYSLDDETYRRLLRANILAKRWDGTVPGAQAAFDVFFIDPATHVFVQDNAQVPYPQILFSFDDEGRGFDQAYWFDAAAAKATTERVDVSMTIGVSGRIPGPLELGLLAQDAIPIKPAGVTTTYAVTSVDGAPLFGFDVQNEFVSGFDVGAWGVEPERLLEA